MKEQTLARSYLDLRREGASFWSIVRKLWGFRALIRLTLIVLPGLLYLVTQNAYYLVICAAFFGASVETLSYDHKTYRLWSFTEKIVNWERVREIADETVS